MTVAASLPAAVTPLNNGLGLTPAMGYSSWNDCSSMRDNGPDGWCWNAEDHVKNLTRYFIDSGLAGGWWVRKSRHAVGVCVFVTAASFRRCCLAPPQPCCIRPRARPRVLLLSPSGIVVVVTKTGLARLVACVHARRPGVHPDQHRRGMVQGARRGRQHGGGL
jgi:hypothetical protein